MKKVGITSGFMYPNSGQKIYSNKTLSYVEKDFVRYFAQKDIMVVIIPDIDDKSLATILLQLDGVVLHGGSDVAPEPYGENPIGYWLGDKIRDDYELKVIDFAYKNKKPILGVCRGCQILNVYFGGTLYQDIPTQIGTRVKHYDEISYDENYHKVEFVGNNVLSELYKNHIGEKYVNSIHHQSIKTIGEDMEILCISPDDGVVEAIQYKKTTPGKILGVQWHPEFNYKLKEKLLSEQVIFDLFYSYL